MLEEELLYAKSPSVSVNVTLNSFQDGKILKSPQNGTVKVGYSFDLKFSMYDGSGYFQGWKAYGKSDGTEILLDDSFVSFEKPLELETSVVVKKVVQNLKIVPLVTANPYVKFVSPKNGSISPVGNMMVAQNQDLLVSTNMDSLYAFSGWLVHDKDGNEIGKVDYKTLLANNGKTFDLKLMENGAASSKTLFTLKNIYVSELLGEASAYFSCGQGIDPNGMTITAMNVVRPEIVMTMPSNSSTDVDRIASIKLVFSKKMKDDFSFETEKLSDGTDGLKSIKNISIKLIADPMLSGNDTARGGEKYFALPKFRDGKSFLAENGTYLAINSTGGSNSSKWLPAKTYVTVTISGELRDEDDIPLGKDVSFTFVTGVVADSKRPTGTVYNIWKKTDENSMETALSLKLDYNQHEEIRANRIGEKRLFKNLTVKRKESDSGDSQLKVAMYIGDDSNTNCVVEDRLVFAAKGTKVIKSGNEYVLDEDVTFFANGSDWTSREGFGRADYEKSVEFDSEFQDFYLNSETGDAGFVFGLNLPVEYDGLHELTVYAKDSFGNISEKSKYYLIQDSIIPSLDLKTGASHLFRDSAGDVFYGNKKDMTMKFDASVLSDIGISESSNLQVGTALDKIKVYYGFSLSENTHPVDFMIAEHKENTVSYASLVKDGKDKRIYVWSKVTDDVGHSLEKCEMSFIADITPPEKPVVKNASGLSNSFYVRNGVNYTKEIVSNISGLTHQMESGDKSAFAKSSGIKNWNWYLDGTLKDSSKTGTSQSFTMGNGKNEISAVDNVGNESEKYVNSYVQDVTGPKLTIEKIYDTTYGCTKASNGDVGIEFTVEENGAGFNGTPIKFNSEYTGILYSKDGKNWTESTNGTIPLAKDTVGKHKFYAKGTVSTEIGSTACKVTIWLPEDNLSNAGEAKYTTIPLDSYNAVVLSSSFVKSCGDSYFPLSLTRMLFETRGTVRFVLDLPPDNGKAGYDSHCFKTEGLSDIKYFTYDGSANALAEINIETFDFESYSLSLSDTKYFVLSGKISGNDGEKKSVKIRIEDAVGNYHSSGDYVFSQNFTIDKTPPKNMPKIYCHGNTNFVQGQNYDGNICYYSTGNTVAFEKVYKTSDIDDKAYAQVFKNLTENVDLKDDSANKNVSDHSVDNKYDWYYMTDGCTYDYYTYDKAGNEGPHLTFVYRKADAATVKIDRISTSYAYDRGYVNLSSDKQLEMGILRSSTNGNKTYLYPGAEIVMEFTVSDNKIGFTTNDISFDNIENANLSKSKDVVYGDKKYIVRGKIKNCSDSNSSVHVTVKDRLGSDRRSNIYYFHAGNSTFPSYNVLEKGINPDGSFYVDFNFGTSALSSPNYLELGNLEYVCTNDYTSRLDKSAVLKCSTTLEKDSNGKAYIHVTGKVNPPSGNEKKEYYIYIKKFNEYSGRNRTLDSSDYGSGFYLQSFTIGNAGK